MQDALMKACYVAMYKERAAARTLLQGQQPSLTSLISPACLLEGTHEQSVFEVNRHVCDHALVLIRHPVIKPDQMS